MFNKIVMVGNLTRDIELRYMQNKTAVGSSAIATTRHFKKQDGSSGEEVCFIDIVFFSRSAEVAKQYLHKGSKVLIEGRLKLDSWVDNGGQKRQKHSVIVESMQMLDAKTSSSKKPNDTTPKRNAQQPKQHEEFGEDGYIPF